jgi:regulator of sigma E protease
METLVAFVIILGVLVFVHELGHFIVAKRSGIQVDEFAFGYPPRLFRLWQEKGKIVVGGRAMMIGHRTNVARQIEVGKRVAYRSHVGGDGQEVVVKVDLVPDDTSDDPRHAPPDPVGAPDEATGERFETEPGSTLGVVEHLERGTEYSINLIPFGGYVRMLGEEDPSAARSFASKSKRIRVAVLVAGAAMNILLAVVVFASTFVLGAPKAVATDNVTVLGLAAGSPAEQAGVQTGDIIVSMDGIRVRSPEDLVALTRERLDTTVRLEIKRGGETLAVTLTPRSNPPEGEGSMGVSIQAAVSKIEVVYYPPLEALWLGVQQTVNTVLLTFSVPLLIIRGILPADVVRPIGPYGIYQQTASAVSATLEMGWWYPVLSLVGLISTALAITNLLPLPALDGGRILFIAIEAVRGRRVDPAREGFVHFVGLAVLLALMLVVSYFDIIQPVSTMDWSSLF